MRCDLGCARYRHDLDRASQSGEEAACDSGKDGCHATRHDLIEGGDPAVLACGDYQPAPPEFEIQPNVQLALGLAHQIPPRYSGVSRAVSDEFRNVLGANEDRLE